MDKIFDRFSDNAAKRNKCGLKDVQHFIQCAMNEANRSNDIVHLYCQSIYTLNNL